MHGDRIPASDPIEAFSSPHNAKCGTSEHTVSPCRLPHQSPALPNRDQEFLDLHDSDLPEISNMFKQNIDGSRKKQVLKEAKARALARLQPSALNSDDDNLEIVASSSVKTTAKEDIQRKSGSKLRISEGRKRQMQFGKVSLMQEKERAFTFSPARGRLMKLGDQNTLNHLIAVEARKEAQRVTRQKEEEWRKHGGQISTNVTGQGQGLADVVKTIAEKGLKAAEARKTDKADIDNSEDEEGSDEDWEPELRGSASPKILPDADLGPDENLPRNEDVAMTDGSEVMEDDVNILVRAARRRIVDSESEDEDENENAHPGLLPIPEEGRYRRSTSSCELPTEDEYDKENNVSLMYDHSEDKENNAVVRHSTPDIPSDCAVLPDFTQSKLLNEKALLDEDPNSDRRRPLGELLSEESSITSPVVHTDLTQSFAAQLQQVSSSKTLTSFLAHEELQPAFDSFSQFSEAEPDIFRPAPLLQPGFSELFESATERQKSSKELNDNLSSDVYFSILNFKLNMTFFHFQVSFWSRNFEKTSAYRYVKFDAGCHASIPGREQINAQG